MKQYLSTKSWRTTAFGVVAILIGLWAWHVHWVPNQSFYFNLFYAETGPLALIMAGMGLIHARDHKHRLPTP